MLRPNSCAPSRRPQSRHGIAQRDTDELFLTAISEAELRYGVAIVPAGQRKDELKAAFDPVARRGIQRPDSAVRQRRRPTPCTDRLPAPPRAGRPIQEADCRIAAISRSRGSVLVTRNVRDFEDIDAIHCRDII